MNEYGFSQGIARNPSESEYPHLWRDLAGLWCPSAGVQGAKLIDFPGKNNGTLVNGPAWASGRKGRTLNFDGVDDYADFGNNSILDFGSADFTVACWLKIASYPNVSGSNPVILGKGNSVTFHGWTIKYFFFSGSSYIQAQLSVSGTQNSINIANPPSGWNHVLIQRKSGVGAIFCNAKLTDSIAITGVVDSASEPFRIGFGAGGAYGQFQIDHVAIHRRALSPKEILQSFQGASPLVRRQDRVSYRQALAAAIFRNRAGSRARLALSA